MSMKMREQKVLIYLFVCYILFEKKEKEKEEANNMGENVTIFI